MTEQLIKQKILFWGIIGMFVIMTGFVFIQKIEASNSSLDGQIEQTIYQGNINLNGPADLHTYVNQQHYYWKKIVIPEINTNQMPDLSVYVKKHPTQINSGDPYSGDFWIQKDNSDSTLVVKNGFLLMRYKIENQNTNQFYYDMNGSYNIVVTYTESQTTPYSEVMLRK